LFVVTLIGRFDRREVDRRHVQVVPQIHQHVRDEPVPLIGARVRVFIREVEGIAHRGEPVPGVIVVGLRQDVAPLILGIDRERLAARHADRPRIQISVPRVFGSLDSRPNVTWLPGLR
jgi:hypothetical protein